MNHKNQDITGNFSTPEGDIIIAREYIDISQIYDELPCQTIRTNCNSRILFENL